MPFMRLQILCVGNRFLSLVRVRPALLFVSALSTRGGQALPRAGHNGSDSCELAVALSKLLPEQRGQVLLPLRDMRHGDARKIVLPLLRDLGVPTEVAPAAAPGGRGDEVAEG